VVVVSSSCYVSLFQFVFNLVFLDYPEFLISVCSSAKACLSLKQVSFLSRLALIGD